MPRLLAEDAGDLGDESLVEHVEERVLIHRRSIGLHQVLASDEDIELEVKSGKKGKEVKSKTGTLITRAQEKAKEFFKGREEVSNAATKANVARTKEKMSRKGKI